MIHWWSKIIQDDPRWSKMVQDDPRWSKVIQDDPRWSKMIQDDPRWSKMIQDDQKWSKMIQDDPRWSKMIESDPRWSKMIQDDRKWSKMILEKLKLFRNDFKCLYHNHIIRYHVLTCSRQVVQIEYLYNNEQYHQQRKQRSSNALTQIFTESSSIIHESSPVLIQWWFNAYSG